MIKGRQISAQKKKKYKGLTLENYQELKRSSQNLLKTYGRNDYKQMSYSRYELVEYLQYNFNWQYWLVVTFGFSPEKEAVEDTLSASHYRFDRWIVTNNKLDLMRDEERSKWICIPEYGSNNRLHYNCFLNLNVRPHKKTYQSEWDAIRVSLKTIFKKLNKGKYGNLNMGIEYEIYERKRCKNLNTIIYSTKEMREQRMYENGNKNINKDTFANTLFSWKDWRVIPLTGKSPKMNIPNLTTINQFFG